MTAEDWDDADDEKWCAERRSEVIDYLARQACNGSATGPPTRTR